MRPYEKLLNKISRELDSLRLEVSSLPDASPFNLPAKFLRTIVSADKPNRVEEIQKRLGKLKSQARAALDTYSRPDWQEGDQAYLSRIVNLIAEIDLLEDQLSKKDWRRLMRDFGNKGKDDDLKANDENKDDEDSEWRGINLDS